MPTQEQIAEHLDIDQSAVSRQMDRLGIDWRIASMDSIRVQYLRNLRKQAAGHVSESGLDLTEERARTERVDRQLKELTLAEKLGQLVNVNQLEPALQQMVGAFKTEIMSLPDKLKAEVDALYGIDVDVHLLEVHIDDCLAQLARYDPERAGTGAPSGEAAGAAREADDNGMGA